MAPSHKADDSFFNQTALGDADSEQILFFRPKLEVAESLGTQASNGV